MPRATASAGGEVFDLARRQGRAAQRRRVEVRHGLQAAQIQLIGPHPAGVDVVSASVDERHPRHRGLRKVESADRAVGDEQVCNPR